MPGDGVAQHTRCSVPLGRGPGPSPPPARSFLDPLRCPRVPRNPAVGSCASTSPRRPRPTARPTRPAWSPGSRPGWRSARAAPWSSASVPPAALSRELPLRHDRLGPPRERTRQDRASARRPGGCGQGTMCDLEVTGRTILVTPRYNQRAPSCRDHGAALGRSGTVAVKACTLQSERVAIRPAHSRRVDRV
jgi:hypothetical protein